MIRLETRSGIPVSIVGLLLSIGWGPGTELVADTDPFLDDELVLLGPLTREEIEAAVPDWVAAQVEATPDMDAAAEMVAALENAEVTVFMGTWCSDSGRELPRLWRALDELGVLNPVQIRYIGVDRDKSEPAKWVAEKNLQLVPTIVVSRGGEEAGRIVESSPNGIERDLLSLLRGDQVGVLSASDDLEPDGKGH